jgi:hypothetical protein
MAPPKIDLSGQRDEITERYLTGMTIPNLASWLDVCEKTVKNRLSEWKVIKRPKTTDTPELRIQIWFLVYQCCLSDKEVLYALQDHGFIITKHSLARIRKEEGIIRRHCLTGDALKESDDELCNILKRHLDQGSVEGYGRGHLHTYFRMQCYPVSR